MNAFLRDLRYSARLLARNPTFTVAVVLSLAIGIGANAAIFSLVNGVLLKPLPFKNSERLVTLWEKPFKDRFQFASLSGANYKDCKEQSRLFDSLSAFADRKEATFAGNKAAERVGTRRVSGDFFATLQVRPVLGRWFLEDEVQTVERPVAIISDALWKRQFAARPDVTGEEITLDREVYNIVGVSPPVFESMGYKPVEVMLPLSLNSKEMMRRDMHLLSVLGRLKPAVALSEAQAEMDVIAARFAEKYPKVDSAPELKIMTPRGLTVGIGNTCAASHPPSSRGGMGNRVGLPGRRNPGERMDAQTVIVTSDYFRTLGIKLVNGRSFTDGDAKGAPAVIIINENLARHLFPSEDPLGKQLELDAAQFPDPDNVQPRTAEIVGVVTDSKQWGATEPLHNVVYVPFAQNPVPSMFVVAKTRIHSAALVDSVRAVVSDLDPDQLVYDVQMMTERIHASESERRFNATLLVLFAGVALVATAIGIYGTLAFWVAQRTHEIGVRMALGAGTGQVLSLVVRKIARLMFVGIALGLPASVAAVQLVRSFLYQGQPGANIFYGVSSVDPVTMVAVLSVLIGSAAVASVIPAWRATRVDPARALQAE